MAEEKLPTEKLPEVCNAIWKSYIKTMTLSDIGFKNEETQHKWVICINEERFEGPRLDQISECSIQINKLSVTGIIKTNWF